MFDLKSGRAALLGGFAPLPVTAVGRWLRAKLAVGQAGQPSQKPAAIALQAQAFVDFFFWQRAGNDDKPVCPIPVARHAQAPLRAHGP